MSSLFDKEVALFFLLLKEIIMYIWSKFRYRGRMKAEDESDITGMVVIVTGANSGIGKEVAYEFGIRRAKVIMACRNLAEGNKAIAEHNQRAMNSGIIFPLDLNLMHLDLMDFGSVRKFCNGVKSKYGRVDILVNNAGIYDTSGRLSRTKEGIEQHIHVNYLAHFLLTKLLLDHMKGNGKLASRIIEVSSTFQLFGIFANEENIMLDKDPETLGIFNTLPYGLSKFYSCLSSKELSRRVDETETLTYSMCPGYVDTGIFRSFNWYMKIAVNIAIFVLGISPSAGCDTILFLALSKVPPRNGSFHRFNQPHDVIERRLEESRDFGIQLWDLSDKIVSGVQ